MDSRSEIGSIQKRVPYRSSIHIAELKDSSLILLFSVLMTAPPPPHFWHIELLFVAVSLGCTSTGRVGLRFLWFYVQELPKAVVLVLKRLRRRGNGLKSHPTDWEKPGIGPATPGLQDKGLSPTPWRLLAQNTQFYAPK